MQRRTAAARLARRREVLRLADADDVPTLDPAAGYDTVSWTFEQTIFDTLVRYGDARRRTCSRPRDALGILARRDDVHLSSARRRALLQRPARHQRRLQIRNRARARSGDALQGHGVLPRNRRRGRLRCASHAARRAESRRPTTHHHLSSDAPDPIFRAQARDAVRVRRSARRRRKMGRGFFAPRRRQRRLHAQANGSAASASCW